MIIRRMMPLNAGLTLLLAVTFAQIKDTTGNPVRVALVKMPYVGERNVPELSGGPDYLEQGGLRQLLEDQGVQASLSPPVALSADEDKACGSWNRLALANGDLAKIVADERRNGHFPVGRRLFQRGTLSRFVCATPTRSNRNSSTAPRFNSLL